MEAWALILTALLVPLCAAADPLQDDASALLSAKNQLAGRSNTKFLSWNGSNPCVWEGVTCTDGRVSALNLTDKGLDGVLPSELGNLTRLETLLLLNNRITGPLPQSLSRLTNLKTLELSGNPLSGEFPKVILEIKSLVDVHLGLCSLTGPFPNIRELPLLEKLHMNSNNFTGGLPDFSNLPLVELSLWGINLGSDWTGIGALRNLTLLSLHSCGLRGPLPAEWGKSLQNVKSLSLNNNSLTGPIPDSWTDMNELQELRLDMNKLTGNVPSWLSSSHLNPNNVYIFCNYFSGEPPKGYPTRNIKGNCFRTGNLRDHGDECNDNTRCWYPKRNRTVPIAIGGALGALLLLGGAAVLWKCNQPKPLMYTDEETGTLNTWEAPTGIERFTLRQLTKATRGFSEESEIGRGGFGKVYRGVLDDGRVVAIKLAEIKGVLNEITLLSRLHHRHLVSLIGFCYQGKHQILVYEYMENGNLRDWLQGESSDKHLDWSKRLDISIGVAQGLDYLHSYADPPVIHRDLKPENILLDGSLVVKIADFGISKISPELETHVSTGPAGTAGYLDPEYFMRRQLTTASDVFSFGVTLLVLVTGQKAIDLTRTEDFNLVEWVKKKLEAEGIRAVVDPRLGDNYPELVFEVLTRTGLQCADFDKTKRPPLKAVLSTLLSLKTGVKLGDGDASTATTLTWTSTAISTLARD